MADLTNEIELSVEWVEISGPANMGDGASYEVEIAGGDKFTTVNWAETDNDTDPPTVAKGHSIKQNDPREYLKNAGSYLWMRLTTPSFLPVYVVYSEI